MLHGGSFGGIIVWSVFHINPLVLVMAAAAATTVAANMPARFFYGGDIVGYFYNLAGFLIHNICSAFIIVCHTIYSTKLKSGKPLQRLPL